MNASTSDLIESLKYSTVLPLKDPLRTSQTILQSNRRELGNNQKSLDQWKKLFEDNGLNLIIELKKLVKSELGENYDIEYNATQGGYLGVGANRKLVLTQVS